MYTLNCGWLYSYVAMYFPFKDHAVQQPQMDHSYIVSHWHIPQPWSADH